MPLQLELSRIVARLPDHKAWRLHIEDSAIHLTVFVNHLLVENVALSIERLCLLPLAEGYILFLRLLGCGGVPNGRDRFGLPVQRLLALETSETISSLLYHPVVVVVVLESVPIEQVLE